jgi:hypothetical protein
MTVQELAAKTAAEIRRRGWYQGEIVDWSGLQGENAERQDSVREYLKNCKVCLLGGMGAAIDGNPLSGDYGMAHLPPDAQELSRLIGGRTGHAPGSIAHWNDATGRTVDEVLALLDSIAAEQVAA